MLGVPDNIWRTVGQGYGKGLSFYSFALQCMYNKNVCDSWIRFSFYLHFSLALRIRLIDFTWMFLIVAHSQPKITESHKVWCFLQIFETYPSCVEECTVSPSSQADITQCVTLWMIDRSEHPLLLCGDRGRGSGDGGRKRQTETTSDT